MFSISAKIKQLVLKLKRKSYRDAYVGEHIRRGIAYQVRALRDQRGWTQADLSRKLKKPQSVVSRIEDPSYGKLTVQTLLELAFVFDTALQIRFASYREFVERNFDLSSKSMEVESFNEKSFGPYSIAAIWTGDEETMIRIPSLAGGGETIAALSLNTEESLDRKELVNYVN